MVTEAARKKRLMKNDEVEETAINIANVIEPGQAIGLIKNYEEITKTQPKRVIVYIAKQEEILNKFKDNAEFLRMQNKVDQQCVTK